MTVAGRATVAHMRLAWLAFGVALAGCLVFPVTNAGAAVLGLVGIALLPVLGYRDGTWRALRWALTVPAAAVVADAITFTPLSLQPETEPALFAYAAVFYGPGWALLVLTGVGARRLGRRGQAAPSAPAGTI